MVGYHGVATTRLTTTQAGAGPPKGSLVIKLVRRAATLFVLPVVAAGAVLATSTVVAAPASAATTLTSQVVTLTNKYRAQKGCAKLRVDARLNKAAQAHSVDQAKRNLMTHTGIGGTTFVTRAKRAGYAYAIGENVAFGYPTAQSVMTAWMKSPGHKANILNCKAKAIGVGIAYSTKRVPYWTQVFGRV